MTEVLPRGATILVAHAPRLTFPNLHHSALVGDYSSEISVKLACYISYVM